MSYNNNNEPSSSSSTSNNNDCPAVSPAYLGTSYRSSVRGSYNSNLEGGIKYVHELPYFERKEICLIFDERNQWEILGK